MRNLSAEEKAFIWLDAFPLPLGEKNALLKACLLYTSDAADD